MEGGKEQNYWPGFVDALSNVVLTLVFVLVIFVFALVMASSKVAEKVEKRVRNEMAETSEAKPQSSSSAAIEARALDQMRSGAVAIKGAEGELILRYPLGVTDMDEKSAEQFEKDLAEKIKAAGPQHKVLMRSIVGKETYSAARRFAYYRAINVRNKLIKLGEEATNISMSIINSPEPEEGRVEIIFKKN